MLKWLLWLFASSVSAMEFPCHLEGLISCGGPGNCYKIVCQNASWYGRAEEQELTARCHATVEVKYGPKTQPGQFYEKSFDYQEVSLENLLKYQTTYRHEPLLLNEDAKFGPVLLPKMYEKLEKKIYLLGMDCQLTAILKPQQWSQKIEDFDLRPLPKKKEKTNQRFSFIKKKKKKKHKSSKN